MACAAGYLGRSSCSLIAKVVSYTMNSTRAARFTPMSCSKTVAPAIFTTTASHSSPEACSAAGRQQAVEAHANLGSPMPVY